MAGDLHKPLIELLEDERKNGYAVGKKAGIREVVEAIEGYGVMYRGNPSGIKS